MPTGLYGDQLEIRNSFGHSNTSPPTFIDNNSICFVSGNIVNLVTISHDRGEQPHTAQLKTSSSTDLSAIRPADAAPTANHDIGNPPQQIVDHSPNLGLAPQNGSLPASKCITAEGQITSFAVSRREGVIAFAEAGSTDIRLVKWPSGTPAGALQAHPDLNIISMAFSFDGQYFASLGDLPSFQLSIWNWKTGSLLCSESNGSPAKHVSFNPLNWKHLCTSGGSGGIKFWSVSTGFKKSTLQFVEGSKYPKTLSPSSTDPKSLDAASIFKGIPSSSVPAPSSVDALDRKRFSPHHHVWRIDEKLLVTGEDGDAIVQFDPHSGESIFSLSSQSLLLSSGSTEPKMAADKSEVSSGVVDYHGCMTSIVAARDYIAIAGKDGTLRIIRADGNMMPSVSKAVKVSNSSIQNICVSPSYDKLLLSTNDQCLFVYIIATEQLVPVVDNSTSKVSALDVSRITGLLATVSTNGIIRFWDAEQGSVICSVGSSSSSTSFTCISMSSMSATVAVGSAMGVLRVYDTSTILEGKPKLLYRVRLHKPPIKMLAFDSASKFLASISEDGLVYILEAITFRTVGFIQLHSQTIRSMMWSPEDAEEYKTHVGLYVLTTQDTSSSLHKFLVPIEPDADRPTLSYADLQTVIFKVDDVLSDFAIIPSHLSSGKESFYACSLDRKLKVYVFPALPFSSGNGPDFVLHELPVGAPIIEYADYEKPGSHIRLCGLRSWVVSWGPDGHILFRSLLEADKLVKLPVHDSIHGGILDVAVTADGRSAFTIGGDSLLRQCEWVFSQAGKRMATEGAEAVEQLILAQSAVIAEISERIRGIEEVPDAPDSESEQCSAESDNTLEKSDAEIQNKSETHRSNMDVRLKVLYEKLVKAIQKNETLPEFEQLAKQDFIIDFEERDRLAAMTDARVRQIRESIEKENLKKRVIRDRIKRSFWDCMEVVGQSVKSFRPDPLTGNLMDVQNYSIRKRSSEELLEISKLKTLRKVQLAVAFATKQMQRKTSLRDAEGDEETEKDPPDFPNLINAELLFDRFELITDARRRLQIVLLRETNHDIKVTYNEKFKQLVKLKSDEISKIEEKNERILAIMQELQIKEPIFSPNLDNDEVPERRITVLDEEVKVEKYITEEEQRKIDERKRLEEERLKAAQEDNFRERALMEMMGGKLEDRAESEDKEELVRPDWMNKPKEELNDEEKRIIKEFEKKLAVFKEEQEKFKKALETELRKLQGLIGEICDNFDQYLQQFSSDKLVVDQLVLQNELKIIKLTQSIISSENDEMKEAQLLARLEGLRVQKSQCMTELPEIKKELERRREEHEAASKRDKEVEKQFRKEFPSSDSAFESIRKLFKRRDTATNAMARPISPEEQAHNPFVSVEKNILSTDEAILPLDPQQHMPEGIDAEQWGRLVDLRDKKIAAEDELREAQKEFMGMQGLVQGLLNQSEQIKLETERVTNELTEFLEHKFNGLYNLECLFELKQGQVEVPQAPVVTDYSDGILIHRSGVEKLNESIIVLGQAKVDALKEMKEYRKGIHALEWENKMLDFQAEDLVIRTRDIQLLRVTKQMQEYIRSGDEQKQSSEVAALERRAEYSVKAHCHKLDEKATIIAKLKRKIAEKVRENRDLDTQLGALQVSVIDRKQIHDSQLRYHLAGETKGTGALKNIVARRRLVDMAKSQAQDIAILREEVERLRLRTYPAFSTRQQM
ncbi:hypothetical protein BJ742DRAFT_850017 [Cladochytrium replicatum]|nr:hypothetical protein BJ742DRAFT_850017 [Cladochytrium replicatum]